MIENIEGNMKGMEGKDLETSPRYLQLKDVLPTLQKAAEDQAQVNTMLATAGVTAMMGAALVLPGIGVVFSPESQLHEKFGGGEKPLSLTEFQTLFEKFASEIGALKEAANKAYAKLVTELQDKADSIARRCRDAINREKTTVKNRVSDRKDSGWFGSFSRAVTLSDPYQIDINAARQKATTLMNSAKPRIDAALSMISNLPANAESVDPSNPPDFSEIRKSMDTANRIVSTNSRVDTDSSHYELEQKALDVSEQVAYGAIEAFAAVATLGGSAAVSGAKTAVTTAGKGVKYGYKAFKAAYPYVLGAGITTGVVAEQFREEEGESEESGESAEDKFAQEIVDLINADPAQRKEMISAKFMDQIPNGADYTYSEELQNIALSNTIDIGKELIAYAAATTPQEREQIMASVGSKVNAASDAVLDQFLKDNLDEDTYEDYADASSERKENDPYHIQSLSGSMQVMERIAVGDTAGAMQVARAYIKGKFIGVQEDTVSNGKSNQLLEDMAANLVNVTATTTYPLFVAGLQKYSKKGFTKTFMGRVNSTKDFIGDAVSAPFDDAAYNRISGAAGPMWDIVSAQGSEYADIIPLIISIAKASGTVVSEHVDIADLLSTLGGSMAFDAMLLGGTTGVGIASEAMAKGGKLSRVGGRVAKAAKYAPAIISKAKLPHAAKGLTLAELNLKVSSRLG